MAATPVSTYYPNLLAFAPKAPQILLDRLFCETARDFCRRTQAWTYTDNNGCSALGMFATPAQPNAAPSNNSAAGQLVDIISATADYEPLVKTTYEEIYREHPKYFALTGTETGDHKYICVSPFASNTIFVAPSSNAAPAPVIRITGVWIPNTGAVEYDKTLMERWSDVIIDGTVSRLLAMPNRSWSDVNSSVFYRNLYEDRVAEAKHAATDGHMMNVPRTVSYGGY